MGSPEQYCPVCGGTFFAPNLEDPYDEERCWASILTDDRMEWLQNYRLVCRTPLNFKDFFDERYSSSNCALPHANYSNVEGLFISEHADMTYCDVTFEIAGAAYNTFYSNDSGDVLFPIHDACMGIVQEIILHQNRANPISMPRATLVTFYDSLCKQYKKNQDKAHRTGGSPRAGYGYSGLEWDHDYYGARHLQGWNEWEGVHGDEWYCSDPVTIPELTTSILGFLAQCKGSISTPSKFACLQIHEGDSTSAKKSRLEELPVEIINQILSYLPLSKILALRRISKSMASRLCLDQHFWFQGLFSGTMLPHVWDLDKKELLGTKAQNLFENGMRGPVNQTQWDWEALVKLLSKKDCIMNAADVWGMFPIGFRNRCRIWKIVEEAMRLGSIFPSA